MIETASFSQSRELGNQATGVIERQNTGLFPDCPDTKEGSQIPVRPREGGCFIPTLHDELDQTSLQHNHVGIQNSIYLDLKEIKGSFLSYTQGSID